MHDSSLKIMTLMLAMIGTLTYVVLIYFYILKRKMVQRPEIIKRMFPALVATFTALTAVSFTFFMRPSSGNFSIFDTRDKEIIMQIEDLHAQTTRLNAQLTKLQTSLPSVSTNQSVDFALLITPIKTQVEKNEEDIHKFERLLLSDAEKLITLPLLQRDLSSFKTELQATKDNVSNLATLVAETNGQMRWIIGTLALGILALVAPAVKSMFVQSGNQQSAKDKTANQ